MTSLPARPQYKGRRENISSTSFVFIDCFVWSVHSGKSTVFYLLSWRALARCLRSVWILAIWHPMTRTIFAFFVWARSTHAMSSRGKSACTVNFFLWKIFAQVCPSFRGKRGHPSASRDSGSTAAEARRRMKSWGLQFDLVDKLERELSFRACRPRTRSSCWIVMMRSFWHHPIQRLVLCWVMPRKNRRCLRARKLRLNPPNPPALRMTSYWRLLSLYELKGLE